MSGDGRQDEFERVLEAALAVPARPHLSAKVSQALRERREGWEIWRLFAPGRIALIGSLALAAGAAIGFFLPLAGMLDTDTLIAAAFAGSFS